MENKVGEKLPNQEILGGLKAAIARGSSLKDAMMTFYQAGYDKTEIEEAAKAYVKLQHNPNEMAVQKEEPAQEKTPEKKEDKKEKPNPEKPLEKPMEKFLKKPSETKEETKESPKSLTPQKEMKKSPQIFSKQKVVQRISAYDAPEKPKPPRGKALTFVLIFMLLFLLGALATVVLFKDELINFFNSLFT